MHHNYAFLWVLLLVQGNEIRFYRGKILKSIENVISNNDFLAICLFFLTTIKLIFLCVSTQVLHRTCYLMIMSCRARKPYTRVELSFAVLSYIDIAKLDCVKDMIFLGMRKNGLCAFYVAA